MAAAAGSSISATASTASKVSPPRPNKQQPAAVTMTTSTNQELHGARRAVHKPAAGAGHNNSMSSSTSRAKDLSSNKISKTAAKSLNKRRRLTNIKESFKVLKIKYKQFLIKESDNMSQEIVRLEHPSIKEKINTLKSCQKAQMALLAQLDNLYKNVYAHDVERHKQFAEQFGSSQVLLQKRSHQERITQKLLTFSNTVLHSNITWNKLQMISSLSVQRAKLQPIQTANTLPQFQTQVDVPAIADDISKIAAASSSKKTAAHSTNTGTGTIIQDDMNSINNKNNIKQHEDKEPKNNLNLNADKENLIVSKKSRFYSETPDDSLFKSVSNGQTTSVSRSTSSVKVSIEINGKVFCRGDELRVLRNKQVEFIGKLLSISESKLLLKDQKSQTRLDINIQDVSEHKYSLLLVDRRCVK